MAAERYVEILAELKPTFIHHPRAKELIAGLLSELGCDIERTYFDVPRLRTMAHGEYLNAGLAYQFHPHRDTWFSAPHQQLNWWLPVYEIESENSMAFHPQYFDRPVRNSSAGLRLRGVEQDRSPAGRQAGEEGDAQAAAARGAARARARRPRRDPAGRHAGLLCRAAALHGPEHDEPHALQHRLPHGQPGRSGRWRGGAQPRLGVHGNDAAATSCGRATSSRFPRRSSPHTKDVPEPVPRPRPSRAGQKIQRRRPVHPSW